MKGRGFRLACGKEEIHQVDRMLREEGYSLSAPPFHDRARVADDGPRALGSSVAAFFGLVYIQDLSSMLPPLVLAPQPGETVLDLCAAPGGKSGMLSHMVGADGAVVANEPVPKRLSVLRSNFHLQECFNTATTCYPGERYPDAGPFSAILVDAPCSGWGTADKNPKVTTLWTPEKTKPLIELQRGLLARAFELLAPGGRIVYSTCTTHLRENEEQTEWAARELGAEVEPLSEIEGFANEANGSGCLRVHGAEHGGQSFFLARLRKPGGFRDEAVHRAKGGNISESALEDTGKWFTDLGLYPEKLPPGWVDRTEKGVFFAPLRVAEALPSGLKWRGRYIGTEHKKGVRLTARLRSVLPPAEHIEGMNVEDVETLRHLIAGQSFSVGTRGRYLPLYWRDLPLGLLTVKNGRCLFAEKV
ncbi:MAG: RsmB/NOP family class I SAM-dependent RNA methyltransferase [Desulfohalobiaceae bacterium]